MTDQPTPDHVVIRCTDRCVDAESAKLYVRYTSGKGLSLETAWWDDGAGFTITLDQNGHHIGAWEGRSVLRAIEAAVLDLPLMQVDTEQPAPVVTISIGEPYVADPDLPPFPVWARRLSTGGE